MAGHEATVAWTREGDYAANKYARGHEWRFDGGAVVRGSSSPAVVPVPLSDPAGVDPEEALIASAAACHMLWFLDLARRAGFVVERYTDRATGTLGKDADGRMAITKIVLSPDIAFAGAAPDAAALEALHHQAHVHCFIANSLKSEIVVAST